MTYADLRLETFTLYAPLDEGDSNHFPARGRKLFVSRSLLDHLRLLGFKPFPRKGTETTALVRCALVRQ
jgi:hypothetical protein